MNQQVSRAFVGLSFLFCLASVPAFAESADEVEKRVAKLAAFLHELDTTVIPADVDSELQPELAEPKRMLSRSIQDRRRQRNEQDVAEWRAISSREHWERFRNLRIARMRKSLGKFPEPPEDLNVKVTKTLNGDGFQVECVVFESRPGLLVTANLYRPAEARRDG